MADGRRIAYHKTTAQGEGLQRPGLIFLHGLKSDMDGTKALWLENWAAARGLGFLRFDMTGHGQSSGQFTDGCIGDWLRDARDVLEQLTSGPQILVGSSMGGWVACLLARSLPQRVAGLVGIAAAPDFTENGYWASFTPDQRAQLMANGQVVVPSDYDSGYVITRRLIEDGRNHLVLNQPLTLPFPLRLIQGTDDRAVPHEWAVRLLTHAQSPDKQLISVPGGDHRLSSPEQLALLGDVVADLYQRLAQQIGR